MRPCCPQIGDRIYVPASKDPLRFGGLATVKSSTGPKSKAILEVEEHTGVKYWWRDLRHDQDSLCEQFGEQVARMPTEEEQAEIERKKQATREAAEAAEREKWAPKQFVCMNGALLEVPLWEEHFRGKNWAAIIDIDPLKPGGLSRFWFQRGRGPCLYVVPNELKVFDAIEFGADYVRGSGYKDPARWYGVVLQISADFLLVKPCADAASALLFGKQCRTQPSGESATV